MDSQSPVSASCMASYISRLPRSPLMCISFRSTFSKDADKYFAPKSKTYEYVEWDWGRGTEVNEALWDWNTYRYDNFIGGWFKINCDVDFTANGASCPSLGTSTANAIVNGKGHRMLNESSSYLHSQLFSRLSSPIFYSRCNR